MHWRLDVTFREDANATIDKTAAQNLNIIRKWCLSILNVTELSKRKLSMKKKRFAISLRPTMLLEIVLNAWKKTTRSSAWGWAFMQSSCQRETCSWQISAPFHNRNTLVLASDVAHSFPVLCGHRRTALFFQRVTNTGKSLFCVTLCSMFITAARMECLSLC